MPSSLSSFRVLVLVLLELLTTTRVNGCTVTPSAAAVVAGHDLSLSCTTDDNSEYVDAWRLESDANSAQLLYLAPSFYKNGSIRVESFVRDGYLVNDLNTDIQVILTIIKTSTVQANYYYCLCRGSSSAFAYVSVFVSEPTFSSAMEITDGEPVIFTCSVSFNGTANTSITIEDSSGNRLNTSNYDGTSKGLHSFSLDYSATANSNIYQEYFCNITLTNDTSKTMIYSWKLNASVQWVSVRNVQISPIDETQCLNGEKCAMNQTVNCTADGNPKPVTFQWLMSVNGSGFTVTETRNDQLTFKTTGNYAVQCIAFNDIATIRYSNSSRNFTTQVVTERLNYPASGEQNSGNNSNTTQIIVGVVVGVGGFLIVLAVAIFLIIKRKKSRTVCCNPDDKETRSNQSVELSKHHNGNKSLSTDNGVQNKSFVKSGNDDVTLVENDLYSGKQSKTQIDPSDGGYASVNEVMQQSK